MASQNEKQTQQDIIAEEKALCIIPHNYTAPNTRLGNSLFKAPQDLITGDDIFFCPYGPQKSTRITCKFTVNPLGERFLSWYDKAVYNAICSIYQEKKTLNLQTSTGCVAMTISNIYSLLVGHACSPSAEQISVVKESINRLRMIAVHVDYSGQYATHKGEKPVIAQIDDYLLNAVTITLTVGGVETSGIHLRAEPALYTYAQATNHQLISVPVDLLDIHLIEKSPSGKDVLGNCLQNTKTSIMLRHYLLWRVCYKQCADSSNRIVFSNLIEALSLPSDTRMQQQRIRTLCLQFFAYWKYSGIIKSFELEKEGQKCVAIRFQTQKR